MIQKSRSNQMEQYLTRRRNNGFGENRASFQKLKPLTTTTLNESDSNPSIGFECNICLDLVQDPVVTLCGHLYCWPCIYRWMSFQNHDNLDQQSPQCPVCKTVVSEKTLIPLYGRGETTDASKNDAIPQRPPSPRCLSNIVIPNVATNYSNTFDQSHRLSSPSRRDQSGYTVSTHLADPMIGMLGEMVYSRIFGNSETTLYAYPNSYHLAGSSTPRMRRRVMQTDKSLSRLCFFLFCCMVLCLFLF